MSANLDLVRSMISSGSRRGGREVEESNGSGWGFLRRTDLCGEVLTRRREGSDGSKVGARRLEAPGCT
jgi:hypothetical protein